MAVVEGGGAVMEVVAAAVRRARLAALCSLTMSKSDSSVPVSIFSDMSGEPKT